MGMGATGRLVIVRRLPYRGELHPDYQYTPSLVTAMAGMVASGVYDVVLASRILGERGPKGRMPLYKYAANRLLTAFQNLSTGAKLSEYQSGFRAFSGGVTYLCLRIQTISSSTMRFWHSAATLATASEISCPTTYFGEASSINFRRSVRYGMGVLATTLKLVCQRLRIANFAIFSSLGRRLQLSYSGGSKARPVPQLSEFQGVDEAEPKSKPERPGNE